MQYLQGLDLSNMFSLWQLPCLIAIVGLVWYEVKIIQKRRSAKRTRCVEDSPTDEFSDSLPSAEEVIDEGVVKAEAEAVASNE